MLHRESMNFLLVTALLVCGAFAHGHDANGCAGFQWDVAGICERMRSPATSVSASVKAHESGESLRAGQHYSVALPAQDGVQFSFPPARPARDPMPHGGSLRFT